MEIRYTKFWTEGNKGEGEIPQIRHTKCWTEGNKVYKVLDKVEGEKDGNKV